MATHARKWSAIPNDVVDTFVTPEMPETGYALMPRPVRVAMDIGLFTALRQADVLDLRSPPPTARTIVVKTSKTGRALQFALDDDLRSAIERGRALPSRTASTWVVPNQHWQRYTGSGFRSLWWRYMQKVPAHLGFTFKDLRTTYLDTHKDINAGGHTDPRTLFRHYKVRPVAVIPLGRKDFGHE